MLTRDPKKQNKLNLLVITHSKTEEYNDENHSFVEVLSSCCRLITERKDDAGDKAINKWLYLILNLYPLFEQQESIYSVIIKDGNTASRIDKLKKQLCTDLGMVLKWINAAPIIYDKPEEDLAKLHFSGAFGWGIPDSSQYDFEPSWAVRDFNLEIYKKIRSAFTVEELEAIDSREMKLAVVHLLTGYYIDKYYKMVSSILRKAGLNYIVNYNGTQEDKLSDLLIRLSHNRYKEYLEKGDVNPPSKNEKIGLLDKSICDRSKQKKLIKFLESLTDEMKIEMRSCSKRDFANIVYVLSQYLSCWKEKRYATSKRVLSMFYGIPEPTYKISDPSDYIKTPEGKKLLTLIDKFNESIGQ